MSALPPSHVEGRTVFKRKRPLLSMLESEGAREGGRGAKSAFFEEGKKVSLLKPLNSSAHGVEWSSGGCRGRPSSQPAKQLNLMAK